MVAATVPTAVNGLQRLRVVAGIRSEQENSKVHSLISATVLGTAKIY